MPTQEEMSKMNITGGIWDTDSDCIELIELKEEYADRLNELKEEIERELKIRIEIETKNKVEKENGAFMKRDMEKKIETLEGILREEKKIRDKKIRDKKIDEEYERYELKQLLEDY